MLTDTSSTEASDIVTDEGAGQGCQTLAGPKKPDANYWGRRRVCSASAGKATPMTPNRAHSSIIDPDTSCVNQGFDTDDSAGNPCPEPDAIVGYVLGDGNLRNDITLRHHLTTCPDCRLELDALRQAIDELPDE